LAEWSIAPVLKTGVLLKGTGGSNPSLAAIKRWENAFGTTLSNNEASQQNLSPFDGEAEHWWALLSRKQVSPKGDMRVRISPSPPWKNRLMVGHLPGEQAASKKRFVGPIPTSSAKMYNHPQDSFEGC